MKSNKKVKKLLAVFLSATMFFSMGMTSFAEENSIANCNSKLQ